MKKKEKIKKNYGYVSLINLASEQDKRDIKTSEFSVACYCDCGCDCYVTG